MKTFLYFLVWHWKKYKFNIIHLLPIFVICGFLSLGFGILGYRHIGALFLWVDITILIGLCVKALIWDLIIEPIMESFKEFKDEQQYIMDKLAGERIRQRRFED